MAKIHLIEALVLIILAVAFISIVSYGGWDAQAQPLVTSYNTSFWNLNQTYPSLSLNVTPIDNATYNGVTITYSDVWFNSNFFNGSTAVIHGVLMQPNGTDLPGLLLLPDFGETAQSVLSLGTAVASNGYAVLALDLPGSGNSTGMQLTPENLVNISDGPSSSYYYQSLIAASRAVTAMDSIPSVNSSEIAVLGVSQGGVTAIQLSSVDSRIKAVIPVLSGGYLDENVLRGSLLGFSLPAGLSVSSSEFKALVSYFDGNAYAQQLSIPALFIAGTNDQYFLLDQVNATYDSVQSQKAILLEPNQNSSLPDDLNGTIVTWLNQCLLGANTTLPTPSIAGATSTNFYTALDISVTQPSNGSSPSFANYTYALYYRYSMPGSSWSKIILNGASGNGTNASDASGIVQLPPLPTNVEYFIAVTSNGTIVSTSPLYQTQTTSSYFVIIMLFVIMVGILLAFSWSGEIGAYISANKRNTLLLVIGLIVWVVAAFSLTQPWVSIPGKAALNVMQVWNLFPSLSSVYVILGLTLMALVGYAVRMWLGGAILILTGAITAVAMLNVFNPYGAINFAWGAYLFGACIAVSLLIPAVLKILE